MNKDKQEHPEKNTPENRSENAAGNKTAGSPPTESPVELPMISGKWVIISIVAVALGMSGFAWWNSYRVGSRTRQLWGVENARLIRYAPKATLTKLEDAEESEMSESTTVSADGAGWIHARDALIRDTAYEWTDSPIEASAKNNWQYKIVFEEENESFTLWMNLETGLVKTDDSSSQRQGMLTKETREAMKKFFTKQFSESSDTESNSNTNSNANSGENDET